MQTDKSMRLGRVAENVAFNVLLNGSHMMWQFEEIGYDFSINSELEHPFANNESYRCNKKTRPEDQGYFKDPDRVAAYEKCAQTIQLRTKIMPEVFAGNPTEAKLNGGYKLRSIQWGSNVYVVANFDVFDAQTASLPSGTWYDYFANGANASGSVSLQPGELKIYTGKKVELPTINKNLESLLPVENVEIAAPQARKIMQNGQVLILRGDNTYTLTGQLID